MKKLFTGMIVTCALLILHHESSFADCVGTRIYPVYTFVDQYGQTWKEYFASPGYDDGGSVSYSIDPSTGTLTVNWTRGDNAHYTVVKTDDDGNFAGQTVVHITFPSPTTFYLNPNSMCNSQTSTFAVSTCPSTTLTWTAPSGWSINGGSNTLATTSQSVSITAPSTGNDLYTISVSSSNGTSASTNVWLGVPFNVQINGPVSVYANTPNTYELAAYDYHPSLAQQGVSTSAVWSFPNGSPNGYCNNCDALTTVLSIDAGTTFQGHVHNACGNSPDVSIEIGIITSGGGGSCPPEGCIEPFSYYPNPASDAVVISFMPTVNDGGYHAKSSNGNLATVNLFDSGDKIRNYSWKGDGELQAAVRQNGLVLKSSNTKVSDIALYNTMGDKVHTISNSELLNEIKVGHLTNGIYYLVVRRDGKTYQKQIVIRH